MRGTYQRLKTGLNHRLDRIISWCRLALMGIHGIPGERLQSLTKRAVRFIGDLSWQIEAFPRLPAFRIHDDNWNIFLIGSESSAREISQLFTKGQGQIEVSGRVALWQIRSSIQHWLDEGATLVVYEHTLDLLRRPYWPISFRVETWVNQQITVMMPVESYISGKNFQNVRHHLNKASKASFTARYSQADEDYDCFYHDLYVPFVTQRHGSLSQMSPYHDQRSRWFVRGGLMMVHQMDRMVAGSLCVLADHTCYAIEEGIRIHEPEIMRSGVNSFLVQSLLRWSAEQGAKFLDLGASHGWRSGGSFQFKTDWGARVVKASRIYPHWTFAARTLTDAQCMIINRIGFIAEAEHHFVSVLVETAADSLDSAWLNTQVYEAQRDGLDGVMVVAPDVPSRLVVTETQTSGG